MTAWTATAAALVLLAVGYAVGRYRPALRLSDWAHWQTYSTRQRRRTARWWAVWTILSAENLAWLVAHPQQGWDAWKHRNDPPPPRGPAPVFDPDWAAKRRTAAHQNTEEA